MKMIKYIFFAFIAITTFLNLSAQNSTTSFDGKVFTIDNYIGEKFDNTEDLTFENGYVEGSICVQYGFEKAKYTSTNEEGKLETFSCTMLSKEHGKMVWKGEIKEENIGGSYVWTKEGQDPIVYTFKGKLKK